MTAPVLISFATAPPVNGVDVVVGDGPEPPLLVLFEEEVLLPGLPATSVKFAHVRRVVLLVCTTTDRLPKKDAGPSAVER